MNTIVVGRKNGVDVHVSLDDPIAIRKALDDLEMDLVRIRAQIDEAKTKSLTGDYSDADWFRKANTALRFKGVAHQRLQRRLGELKKAERDLKNDSLAERFVTIARRRLDDEVFMSIMDEAREER